VKKPKKTIWMIISDFYDHLRRLWDGCARNFHLFRSCTAARVHPSSRRQRFCPPAFPEAIAASEGQ
jgi:hypothetical protein